MKEFAAASPNPKLRGGDEYAVWLLERVEVDTASFSAASFEIDVKRKLPGRKIGSSPGIEADATDQHFSPRVRGYLQDVPVAARSVSSGERANSQVWKKLKATAESLNVSAGEPFE